MLRLWEYVRSNPVAQLAAILSALVIGAGAVNDVVSFFNASWMPKWGPSLIGIALLYVAFQAVGYRVFLATKKLEDALKDLPTTAEPGPLVLGQAAQPTLPRRRAEARDKSPWKPDTTFGAGVNHLVHCSKWRPPYSSIRPTEDAVDTLRQALASSKLTAWAREHPHDEEFQVSPKAWEHGVEIRWGDSWAFVASLGVTLHQVRLCQEQLEAAWPRQGAS